MQEGEFLFCCTGQCTHHCTWECLARGTNPCPKHLKLSQKGVCSTRLNHCKLYPYLPLNLPNFLLYLLLIKSFCLAAERAGVLSHQLCWHFKCKYHGNLLSINDVRKNNNIFPKLQLNCHKLSTIFLPGPTIIDKEVPFAPLQLQSPDHPKSWISHDLSMEGAPPWTTGSLHRSLKVLRRSLRQCY